MSTIVNVKFSTFSYVRNFFSFFYFILEYISTKKLTSFCTGLLSSQIKMEFDKHFPTDAFYKNKQISSRHFPNPILR